MTVVDEYSSSYVTCQAKMTNRDTRKGSNYILHTHVLVTYNLPDMIVSVSIRLPSCV